LSHSLILSPDHAFRQSLSPIAKEACKIVDQIKKDEAKSIWNPEVENKIADEFNATVHPGMMFNLAKSTMEKTKLWKIVKKMPKGALLHTHMDALVDLDWLINALLTTPGMHVHCEQSLHNPKTQEFAPIQFKWLKSDYRESLTLKSKQY
jgi:adenosine deaminase CECR1